MIAEGCSCSSGSSTTFSRWASARISSVAKRSSTEASFICFALFFALQHLLGEIVICFRHFAFGVVGIDALAYSAALLGADGIGNDRVKYPDLPAVGVPGSAG